MTYFGPTNCPNCQNPISVDHLACPYCSSLAPATAPWQYWGDGSLWQFVLVAVLVLCILCDLFLGTGIFKAIADWLPANSDSTALLQ